MKYFTFITLLLTLVLFGFKKQDECRKTSQSLQDYFHWQAGKQMPILMAHRLSPLISEPENALSTFEATYRRYPCAIQELDIRMSSDGKLVLMHDSTLDRTTNGTGPVRLQSLKALKALRLKDGAGNLLTESIPTLEELLVRAKGKSILALDVKPGTDIEKVMQAVIAAQMTDQVFLILYSLQEAKDFHAKYPHMMMAIGFNSWDHINAIEQSGLPFQNLVALTPQQLQPKAFYDKIHAMGIMTSASAFGNIDRLPADTLTAVYQQIFTTGGDIICTDSMHNVVHAFAQ